MLPLLVVHFPLPHFPLPFFSYLFVFVCLLLASAQALLPLHLRMRLSLHPLIGQSVPTLARSVCRPRRRTMQVHGWSEPLSLPIAVTEFLPANLFPNPEPEPLSEEPHTPCLFKSLPLYNMTLIPPHQLCCYAVYFPCVDSVWVVSLLSLSVAWKVVFGQIFVPCRPRSFYDFSFKFYNFFLLSIQVNCQKWNLLGLQAPFRTARPLFHMISGRSPRPQEAPTQPLLAHRPASLTPNLPPHGGVVLWG